MLIKEREEEKPVEGLVDAPRMRILEMEKRKKEKEE
jgi:hypothetical protein